MTQSELLSMAVSETPFNTNNAWGFGGAYGTRYYFKNGVVLTIGKACYRHTGESSFSRVDTKDQYGIIDVKKLSKEDILQISELIK